MENEEEKDKLREDRLNKLLGQEKKSDEEKKREALMREVAEFICSNKWCKAPFKMVRYKYYDQKITSCPKCRSFDNELSGGVTFEDKDYSGTRHDNSPHPVAFKFSDYVKGKWGKFWGK